MEIPQHLKASNPLTEESQQKVFQRRLEAVAKINCVENLPLSAQFELIRQKNNIDGLTKDQLQELFKKCLEQFIIKQEQLKIALRDGIF